MNCEFPFLQASNLAIEHCTFGSAFLRERAVQCSKGFATNLHDLGVEAMNRLDEIVRQNSLMCADRALENALDNAKLLN